MNRHKLRLLLIMLVFVALFLLLMSVLVSRLNSENKAPSEPSYQILPELTYPTVPVPPVSQSTAPKETTEPATAETTQATEETVAETTEATEETTEATEETTEATEETTEETTDVVEMDLGLLIAKLAGEQIGKPYKYGTAGPDSFDTSGLLKYCFGQYGISVPRSNAEQAVFGYEISKEELRPGDVVFFWSSQEGKPEYMGIYVGNSIVVAALNDSKPVVEFNIETPYYTSHYVYSRRFF